MSAATSRLVTSLEFSTRKLHRFRRRRALRGTDLARAARIDRERFFAIEEGAARPKFGEGMALARVLRVGPEDLGVRRRVRVRFE